MAGAFVQPKLHSTRTGKFVCGLKYQVSGDGEGRLTGKFFGTTGMNVTAVSVSVPTTTGPTYCKEALVRNSLKSVVATNIGVNGMDCGVGSVAEAVVEGVAVGLDEFVAVVGIGDAGRVAGGAGIGVFGSVLTTA